MMSDVSARLSRPASLVAPFSVLNVLPYNQGIVCHVSCLVS